MWFLRLDRAPYFCFTSTIADSYMQYRHLLLNKYIIKMLYWDIFWANHWIRLLNWFTDMNILNGFTSMNHNDEFKQKRAVWSESLGNVGSYRGPEGTHGSFYCSCVKQCRKGDQRGCVEENLWLMGEGTNLLHDPSNGCCL